MYLPVPKLKVGCAFATFESFVGSTGSMTSNGVASSYCQYCPVRFIKLSFPPYVSRLIGILNSAIFYPAPPVGQVSDDASGCFHARVIPFAAFVPTPTQPVVPSVCCTSLRPPLQ